MIPEHIGRYIVRAEIGRGGMGTVYHAYDPSFERDVAIKVLPRELLHTPGFRARFEREARTIAALDHPAIVPVYDFGEEEGQPYLVMRYMSGGSLASLIRIGPMAVDRCVAILSRLASALDEAHAQGIVHRDLKPNNILFDQRGEAFIADFGLVKLSSAGELTPITGSGVVGTPAYMAPEIARGGDVTPLSDIYALGVTLFEMLTGEAPFNAATPIGVMMAHITDPIPDILLHRPDLPPDVQTVIDRAMAKEPRRRYQSAGALSRDFALAAEGQLREHLPAVTGGPDTLPFVEAEVQAEPVVPVDATPFSSATPLLIEAAPPAPAAVEVPPRVPALRRFRWVAAVLLMQFLIVAGVLLALLYGPDLLHRMSQSVPTRTPAAAPVLNVRRLFGSVGYSAHGAPFDALLDAMDVASGDIVRTDATGAALLILGEGTSVEIQPMTMLVIERLRVDDDTFAIELRQEEGSTYSFITPVPDGRAFSFVLYTPPGVVYATDARFYVAQQEDGWVFLPTDGTLTLDPGEPDDQADDDYILRAADHACLRVRADLDTESCSGDIMPVRLTNGRELLPTPVP